MSRPRDESRRTELAKQACAVLQREGLGISAERLASELGLKRPSLLYYFPTYADILQVALVDLLSVQTAYVSERVSRESHPLRQLYARICATYDFHETRGEHVLFLTQALAATLGSKVADLLKVASAIFDDQRRDMVQRIEQGVEEGLVHPCDAEGLVEMSRVVIDGLTVQRVLGVNDPARIHKFVWDQILAPLVRRETKGRTPAAKRAPYTKTSETRTP